MAGRGRDFRSNSETPDPAARVLARQRPPARDVLDDDSERRRTRRSMAAAAAARAGGVLSLTAVLLGTPALSFAADSPLAGTSAIAAVRAAAAPASGSAIDERRDASATDAAR
jgi:hypothetical protein